MARPTQPRNTKARRRKSPRRQALETIMFELPERFRESHITKALEAARPGLSRGNYAAQGLGYDPAVIGDEMARLELAEPSRDFADVDRSWVNLHVRRIGKGADFADALPPSRPEERAAFDAAVRKF